MGPDRPQTILLPVRMGTIVASFAGALLLNFLPWPDLALVPDFVALVLTFWCVRQPRLVGRCWIGGDAVQQDEPAAAAAFAEVIDNGVYFVEGRAAGREDQRQATAGDGVQQRQVHQVRRGDLDGRHVHIRERA